MWGLKRWDVFDGAVEELPTGLDLLTPPPLNSFGGSPTSMNTTDGRNLQLFPCVRTDVGELIWCVKRTARSCVSDLQLKCSCFYWGDRQMLHEWVIVALLPGLFRGPRGIYQQSCGSASKLCQNILALGQDVLSPEKSQLFIDFLLMSKTELGWLMWKQNPNESQIPEECSSVTGWFLQLRDVCLHHNGAKVASMTALKQLQHWGCGSWLICDWLWLPPQRSTDDSGMVNETWSQPPFAFLHADYSKYNQTFFKNFISHCWFPLPSTASHLSLLVPSFTLPLSASFLSLSLPDTICRFNLYFNHARKSVGSAYICTH